MKRTVAAVFVVLALWSSGNAAAAERRATLQVENMYCATCPFIVKRTLAGVPGVTNVQISYQEATAVAVAVVDYEDTEVDVAALLAATSGIGFPSHAIRQLGHE